MRQNIKIILFCFFIINIAAEEQVYKKIRYLTDSYAMVQAQGEEAVCEKAITKALDKIEEIKKKFDSHNPESEIYKFNHDGTPINDPEVIKVVKTALQVSEQTDGAFDITIYPLLELWGFYENDLRLPPKEDIVKCLENVGYKYLKLEDGVLTKTKSEVKIELGGIAGGYSVDEGVKVLQENGITAGLVDESGDIYVLGEKKKSPWRVGIRHPRNKNNVLGYLELSNTAVVGSGDYERFFIEDGARYHHIFNPKTGYPTNSFAGITVLYPNATIADIMSTTLFVLGKSEGMEYLKKVLYLEAIIVDDNGEIICSDGLKDLIKKLKK